MQWFPSIHRKLDSIIQQWRWTVQEIAKISREIKKMSQQSDQLLASVSGLTTKVKTLTDNVAAHDTTVQNEIEALTAALAKAGVPDDPAVAQAIQNISDASTAVADAAAKVATETDKLSASLPAAGGTVTPGATG